MKRPDARAFLSSGNMPNLDGDDAKISCKLK
jgi:hypothetical protein